MEIINNNMNIGKPQYENLITNCKIRKEMKELDKTLITDRLKIKGESLTYNRVHRLTYVIYRAISVNFDDKLKRLVTIFNWI